MTRSKEKGRRSKRRIVMGTVCEWGFKSVYLWRVSSIRYRGTKGGSKRGERMTGESEGSE